MAVILFALALSLTGCSSEKTEEPKAESKDRAEGFTTGIIKAPKKAKEVSGEQTDRIRQQERFLEDSE